MTDKLKDMFEAYRLSDNGDGSFNLNKFNEYLDSKGHCRCEPVIAAGVADVDLCDECREAIAAGGKASWHK